MSKQELLIKATNLGHTFDYRLFQNVSLELEEGKSIAIVGRSGSGKSTLLHHLATFLPPHEGEVVLFGKAIYGANSKVDIENIRRYDIGIIFQSHYLFKGMKASDNIAIATMLSNQEFPTHFLDKLEISSLMEQKTSELSGGQQQRVSIARVLSKNPKIIFADEPTGNLDKETARLVMEVLLEYIKKQKGGLVMVTHDYEIAKMCDEVFVLENQSLQPIVVQ